jgi:hypothetical protein
MKDKGFPRYIVKVDGHLVGYDDKEHAGFSIDYKKLPLKSMKENELDALMSAIASGTAIKLDDPANDLDGLE